MRTTLKIFSIIAVVIGSLALISSVTEGGQDAGYSFLGAVMFLTQGILALVYISQQNKQ